MSSTSTTSPQTSDSTTPTSSGTTSSGTTSGTTTGSNTTSGSTTGASGTTSGTTSESGTTSGTTTDSGTTSGSTTGPSGTTSGTTDSGSGTAAGTGSTSVDDAEDDECDVRTHRHHSDHPFWRPYVDTMCNEDWWLWVCCVIIMISIVAFFIYLVRGLSERSRVRTSKFTTSPGFGPALSNSPPVFYTA